MVRKETVRLRHLHRHRPPSLDHRTMMSRWIFWPRQRKKSSLNERMTMWRLRWVRPRHGSVPQVANKARRCLPRHGWHLLSSVEPGRHTRYHTHQATVALASGRHTRLVINQLPSPPSTTRSPAKAPRLFSHASRHSIHSDGTCLCMPLNRDLACNRQKVCIQP